MRERNRDGFSLANWLKSAGVKRPRASARLGLEQLEDRLVPSGVPAVDLTTPGATGAVNGAIFQQVNPQPTGCGVIHDFVRIQAHGSSQMVEQGFNTGARPLQYDEQSSPTFTRNLQLSELPKVDVGGISYRTFLLGVNQKHSQPLVSLDELRLYSSNSPNLTGYDPTTNQLAGLSPVYDMGASNWIKLDASLTHGNGSGDMTLYVPDSAFAGNTYVYLYSKFGENYGCNGGFEQWAPGQASATPTTGVISGTVTNQATGVGVADQMVFIDVSGTGTFNSGDVYTFTDANGNYSFNNLATGVGSFSTYNIYVATSSDWTLATSEQAISLANQTTVTNVNFQVFQSAPSSSGSSSAPAVGVS
jgi:hypothetical protein